MQSIFFIMGVAGSGKTTIGSALAQQLNIPFMDADHEHPVENINKMTAGIPLTDEDRLPWLLKVHAKALAASAEGGAVIACSALKQAYRNLLENTLLKVYWIFLDVERSVLIQRLSNRKNHYMPVSLLDSQLATLEKPKDAICINAKRTVEEAVEFIRQSIYLKEKRIGIVGLGVMGKALARNLGSKGWQLSLYNREVSGVEELVAKQCVDNFSELHKALPFNDIDAFVKSLGDSQYILMMLPAGKAIVEFLNMLSPLLSPGAIIIDGANAFYADTEKHQQQLLLHHIYLLGCGVSGGEQGALEGPALMVSGDKKAYDSVAPLLISMAAINGSGNSCCNYIGLGGSGHYVKMVHNAIEYGEMQLLAEVYGILHHGLQLDAEAIASIFNEWQKTELQSYLLGITQQILKTKYNHQSILTSISDKAYSKGTGAWATQEAAFLGAPSGMFTTALNARYISTDTRLRYWMQEHVTHSEHKIKHEHVQINVEDIKAVYTLVRIWNHHQGFALITKAAEQYGWDLSLSSIADGWRAGCIVRSSLMDILSEGFTQTNMVSAIPYCEEVLVSNYPNLIQLVAHISLAEIPIPIISEAYQSILQYKQKKLTTTLIQAQRDFFGAHGFQWDDDIAGTVRHFDWT
ncbi:MAG: NADP-dependent phosphogluconate dehydrogenase [Chitinophagaceae bacterium]|nr:NADP-dependent phosphogluconate dehydrogenase [Chitinophagaceae bacterium]